MSRLPAILGAPVVLAQATALRRRVPLIDPPREPWSGIVGGAEPARRILVLGDSTAIGTGVDSASEGLAARIGARLAERDGVAVGWSAIGHNGDTAAEVVRDHLARAMDTEADDVVVLVGWNDAMRLVSPRAFARAFAELLRTLGTRPGVRVLAVAAPRFELYTVMPRPLRDALGSAARGIRRTGARVAADAAVPLVAGFDGSSVNAVDGFHPDAAAYDRLAATIVDRLL